MSPVSVIRADDGGLVELLIDPAAWVPEPVAQHAGPSLRAVTLLRRHLSTAELADCACPADCPRDHPNE